MSIILYKIKTVSSLEPSSNLKSVDTSMTMGNVQNPPAIKIYPRSESTQSNLRTAYQSRVRVRGNSDSEK